MSFVFSDSNKWKIMKDGSRYRIATNNSFAEILQAGLTALQLCSVIYKPMNELESVIPNNSLEYSKELYNDYDFIERLSCIETKTTPDSSRKYKKNFRKDRSRNKKNHRKMGKIVSPSEEFSLEDIMTIDYFNCLQNFDYWDAIDILSKICYYCGKYSNNFCELCYKCKECTSEYHNKKDSCPLNTFCEFDYMGYYDIDTCDCFACTSKEIERSNFK